MSRIIWKGAISFGLVHVPVVVYPGSRPSRLDFDLLDRRDNARIGYQRINKNTGKPIEPENIVKGYEYEKEEYVYMSDEDFENVNVAAAQTVELMNFVEAADIPIYYYDTPYYLTPDKRGEKGYVLLREVLKKSGRVGIANVVLHTKQHLAAVLPLGDALVMVTMRYASEILALDDLDLPAKSGKNAPTAGEIDMAMRLVKDMTQPWKPEAYTDTYREDLLAAIEKIIKSGKTHVLGTTADEAAPRKSAKVIDLMSMLKQSIEKRSGASPAKDDSPKKRTGASPAARKPAAKKTTARKAARKPASVPRRKAA